MSEARDIAWRRMSLEFFVVVFGILAALAVDDWRQGRDDRALEEHLLTSLVEDLRIDSDDADLQTRVSTGTINAADALLALVGHPQAPNDLSPSEDPVSVDELLRRLSFLAELEIADGTYTEMISTGTFRVIRNAALRREISTYYSESKRVIEIPRRQVDPRPELLSALAGVGLVPGRSAAVPDQLARLRRDPMIATHVIRIQQYYANQFAVEFMGSRRQALQASVAAELGRFR